MAAETPSCGRKGRRKGGRCRFRAQKERGRRREETDGQKEVG